MDHPPARWVFRMMSLLLVLGAVSAPPAAAQQNAAAEPNSDGALFGNFMHNAVIGRFERANAYAGQLLANNPDPLAALGFADEYTNAVETLILLVNNPEVSENAKLILDLLRQGELLLRQDPNRIRLNIEKLGGDPLSEFNAINRLKESGEYAVPWLLDALADQAQERLHTRIIRMLPKMGKNAVTPLCTALNMDHAELKQFIVKALGEIGYPQAAPYLLRIQEDSVSSPEMRLMTEEALNSMGYSGLRSANQAFQDLATQYYDDQGSVKADPRMDTANVWYWNGQRLERIVVPREIYNEIMAMRCCEDALLLDPSNEDVIALWLAANIQREADLGMDVESAEPDPAAAADATKREDYPRSAYFARAAGARYCHRVLQLALDRGEPAVALGAIAALRLVAGESTLVGAEHETPPLVAALAFPDVLVRVKAALALAEAHPSHPFAGAQHVVPALAEGLAQSGGMSIVVVDPDDQSRNAVLDVVRAEGATAVGDASLYAALDRARAELPTVNALFLATDVSEPELGVAIATIRANHLYRMTPIILLSKEGRSERVKVFTAADDFTSAVVSPASPNDLLAAWQAVSGKAGQTQLTRDDALQLALQCAWALRALGLNRSDVLDYRRAEAALITALNRGSEELQINAAAVLAMIPSPAAQQSIAAAALDPQASTALRVSAFAALAESAQINGNLLDEPTANALGEMSLRDPDLVLRSAASQALGALDLPGIKASQVILQNRGG